MDAGLLQISHLRHCVRTKRVGRRIEHTVSTASTNDEVRRRIDDSDADGLVFFAEHQTAGRGRFGRVWRAPRGASLLCSVAVVDQRRELSGTDVALLSVVAMCDAVRAATRVEPTIKWPNDLVVGGRKLGGVLIDSTIRADGSRVYVIGIGINCLQQAGHFDAEISHSATSLEMESSQSVSQTALAGALLEELDRWLYEPDRWDFQDLRSAWLERSRAQGRRVVVRCRDVEHAGIVDDLNEDGALVVSLDDGGTRAFGASDSTVALWCESGLAVSQSPGERAARMPSMGFLPGSLS